MALTPKISNTNLIPAVGRLPAASAVASTDSNPLSEISQYNALVNDGAGFRYENYAGDRRRSTDHRFLERQPARRINTGMLSGTSQGFAAAFTEATNESPLGPKGLSETTMSRGIGTYELTSQVIYDELPTRGENLSMTL